MWDDCWWRTSMCLHNKTFKPLNTHNQPPKRQYSGGNQISAWNTDPFFHRPLFIPQKFLILVFLQHTDASIRTPLTNKTDHYNAESEINKSRFDSIFSRKWNSFVQQLYWCEDRGRSCLLSAVSCQRSCGGFGWDYDEGILVMILTKKKKKKTSTFSVSVSN